MKVTGVLLLFLFFVPFGLFPQHNPGAKQISLSHSDVALNNDVFAIFNNPAGLSNLKFREAGFYYSPAPFGFKEMSNAVAAYAEPLKFGTAAAGVMKYGFELYNEFKTVLGFSYFSDSNFFAGISVTYHSVSISGYGNDFAVYAGLGGVIYLSRNLLFGFNLHNVNRASFGDEEGQIPVSMSAGLSLIPVEELSINFAVEKDIIFKGSIRFGIDYKLIKYFSVRMGFATEPSNFSAGTGIQYSLFRFDYAVFNHPDLGYTHQAGIIVTFNEGVY